MKAKAKFWAPMASEKSSGRCSVLRVLTLVFVMGFCHPLGSAQEAVVLVGAGSSVPAPLYNKWAQEYNKRNPAIQMKYVPMGTSEGIKQISRGSGDFGAGEAQSRNARKGT
jgi:phosphate transport system substrate-binding protein